MSCILATTIIAANSDLLAMTTLVVADNRRLLAMTNKVVTNSDLFTVTLCVITTNMWTK